MAYRLLLSELSSISIKPYVLCNQVYYFTFGSGERGVLVVTGFRGYEYSLVRGVLKLAILLKRSYKYEFTTVTVPCIDVNGFNGLNYTLPAIGEKLDLTSLDYVLEGYSQEVKSTSNFKVYMLVNGKVVVISKIFSSIDDYTKLRDKLIEELKESGVVELLNSIGRVAFYINSDSYWRFYGDKYASLEYVNGKLLFLDELASLTNSWLNRILNSIVSKYNVSFAIILREYSGSTITINIPSILSSIASPHIVKIIQSRVGVSIEVKQCNIDLLNSKANTIIIDIPFTYGSKWKTSITLCILSILCNILANYTYRGLPG